MTTQSIEQIKLSIISDMLDDYLSDVNAVADDVLLAIDEVLRDFDIANNVSLYRSDREKKDVA